MERKKLITIDDIVGLLNDKGYQYSLEVKDNADVHGFSSLKNYEEGTLTWIKNQTNWENDEYMAEDIALAIVQEKVKVPIRNRIVCKESRKVFFAIIEEFFTCEEQVEKIGKNTVFGNDVQIAENVIIGNNCSITGNVIIGKGTIIEDNVVIRNRVQIGEACYIQSLCVIGVDGFGYVEDENNEKVMIKHCGGVSIGNHVFIGSHVNIARGTIDNTYIADGVKIAPSTHIGHNNLIGKNSVIIGSQLYGSVQVGENAYIVGSIVRNQQKVGDNSLIGMGSVVTKDIEKNKVVLGTPAKVVKERYTSLSL